MSCNIPKISHQLPISALESSVQDPEGQWEPKGDFTHLEIQQTSNSKFQVPLFD